MGEIWQEREREGERETHTRTHKRRYSTIERQTQGSILCTRTAELGDTRAHLSIHLPVHAHHISFCCGAQRELARALLEPPSREACNSAIPPVVLAPCPQVSIFSPGTPRALIHPASPAHRASILVSRCACSQQAEPARFPAPPHKIQDTCCSSCLPACCPAPPLSAEASAPCAMPACLPACPPVPKQPKLIALTHSSQARLLCRLRHASSPRSSLALPRPGLLERSCCAASPLLPACLPALRKPSQASRAA